MANQRNRKFFNRYVIAGFVAGLLVGPLVTSSLGWQISPGKVSEAVEEAKIDLQVKICLAEANASGAISPTTQADERYQLTRKWAKMPWQESAASTVVNRCYNALG